ncbi:MAG: helix-turn-helix domain-containing protein [Gammaproteobacteria bacterium]
MDSPSERSSDTLLLTVQDAARHLRVSTRTVNRLIGTRALSALKLGRLVRIRFTDLLAFLDGKTRVPDNPGCTGPGVRNRKENVCHTVAKTVPFGGRLTPIQADRELDALLEPPTERRRKPSKPNGSSNRSGPRSGVRSPVDPLPS